MINEGGSPRDLAALVVPAVGGLTDTGDRYEPHRLVDANGTAVEAATFFFRDLLAVGRAESTVRSYGMDLLRWFRFLWAAEVAWDRATRAEARDFSRWFQVAGKRPRPTLACAKPGSRPGYERCPRGWAVCPICTSAQRDGTAGVLRLAPGSSPGLGKCSLVGVRRTAHCRFGSIRSR
jgi:hypothetical protein